ATTTSTRPITTAITSRNGSMARCSSIASAAKPWRQIPSRSPSTRRSDRELTDITGRAPLRRRRARGEQAVEPAAVPVRRERGAAGAARSRDCSTPTELWAGGGEGGQLQQPGAAVERRGGGIGSRRSRHAVFDEIAVRRRDDAARVTGTRSAEHRAGHTGGEQKLRGAGRGQRAAVGAAAVPRRRRAGIERTRLLQAGVLGDAQIDEHSRLVEGDADLIPTRRRGGDAGGVVDRLAEAVAAKGRDRLLVDVADAVGHRGDGSRRIVPSD